MDNFQYFSIKAYTCIETPHQNRLVETVLMRVTIYVFIEKQEKLSLKYLQYPVLYGALITTLKVYIINSLNLYIYVKKIEHSHIYLSF